MLIASTSTFQVTTSTGSTRRTELNQLHMANYMAKMLVLDCPPCLECSEDLAQLSLLCRRPFLEQVHQIAECDKRAHYTAEYHERLSRHDA